VDGSWRNGETLAIISPDREQKSVLFLEGSKVKSQHLDVVFPVLHGLYGEDGTVQGLLELSGIPYVGCGVLASAVSMDKLYTKIIVDALGIRQAAYVAVMAKDLLQMVDVVERVEAKLSYPVFIKPSNAGSSQGVSKAHNREELMEGLNKAVAHDRKILVEETIVGREIECAVLGGNEAKASGVGEIVAAAEFYDYDAKYNNSESRTILSPELPEGVEALVRDYSTRIFKAVDGFGLSRVDFFLTKDGNEVVFNEINTLPGFTSISMYPMLWEAKGIAKQQLVEKLIQSAFTRNAK
jgi:D-alanine-D-alanine ligase